MSHMHNKNKEDTLYTLLGISNKASHEEIKKAYRRLSLVNHPDRNGGDREKSEKYKKITDAYKILSDETERRKYDFSLNNNLENIGANIDPSTFMNMFLNPNEASSILNELNNTPLGNIIGGIGGISIPLGNGGIGIGRARFSDSNMFNNLNNTGFKTEFNTGHDYNSKPPIIFRTINIGLLEAYNGCKVPISITRWIIENDIKNEQTETIYVTIPKGIDNDEIISIPNKGNRINDTNKGDIEIKIGIKNDRSFERNGIDLIYKKSITLKESFCGFSFDLPYIDGREFKINNEAGNVIPPDFRKIIPNLGMKRDDDVGNLIIIFDVNYPKKLSKEQIKELDKIL